MRKLAALALLVPTAALAQMGGVPLRSAMPPFKNVLKQEGIWKIVLYLRAL
jgi:mono/diheme cytochrome c family protein